MSPISLNNSVRLEHLWLFSVRLRGPRRAGLVMSWPVHTVEEGLIDWSDRVNGSIEAAALLDNSEDCRTVVLDLIGQVVRRPNIYLVNTRFE